MKRKKRIEIILKKYLCEYQSKVLDISNKHIGHHNFDGKKETHFSITLNSIKKNKNTKLSIHRKINSLLENEFNSGLHALEIKILD